MNHSRVGKIASLPWAIRESVNRCLRNGVSARGIADTLNEQKVVREILGKEFRGEPINKQNVSAWKLGGYAEWEARQVFLADAKELQVYGGQMAREGSSKLVEKLAVVLAGRYASVVLKWDGKVDEDLEGQVKLLGRLTKDVVWLQRSVERATRLQLAILKEERVVAEKVGEQNQRAANLKADGQMAEVLKEFFRQKEFIDIDGLAESAEKRKAGKRKAETKGKSKRQGPKSKREGSLKSSVSSFQSEGETAAVSESERPVVGSTAADPAGRDTAAVRDGLETGGTGGEGKSGFVEPVCYWENRKVTHAEYVYRKAVAEMVKAGQGLERVPGAGCQVSGEKTVPVVPEPKPEAGGRN